MLNLIVPAFAQNHEGKDTCRVHVRPLEGAREQRTGAAEFTHVGVNYRHPFKNSFFLSPLQEGQGSEVSQRSVPVAGRESAEQVPPEVLRQQAHENRFSREPRSEDAVSFSTK